ERGRLVEAGAPGELMALEGGVYQRLMAAQRTAGPLRDIAAAPDVADRDSPVAVSPPLSPRAVVPTEGALPQSLAARNIWLRLFRLVRPWWWETALVFVLGPLHAASQVALGV